VAERHAVPAAGVLAVAAGCDVVLVCSGQHETQAATLEALIHAVEDGSLARARVEDALKRQRRAKEHYLIPRRAARPATARTLRATLEGATHRAIADEMARFV
jgi:beta-glucosidase-like glycosyl hydrolase